MDILADRAKTDPEAKERLFRELSRWIDWAARRYARRLGEDGPSEVAVAILEALESYDSLMGPFRGWALGAIAFRLRDVCRRERKYQQRTVQMRTGKKIGSSDDSGRSTVSPDAPDAQNVADVDYWVAGQDSDSGLTETPESEAAAREIERAERRADVSNAIRRAGVRLTDAQREALARRMAGEIRREDKDLVYRALQALAELNAC